MRRLHRSASIGGSSACRRTVRIGTLAALLPLSIPTAVGAQYSVRPVVLDFLDAGERAVVVRNESDVTSTIRIYSGDFDQSESGAHRFLPFGGHPSSCHGRLETFPDRLVLDPGADAVLRVRLKAGRSSCWSLVFVERRPPASDGQARAIERIAVQVLGHGSEPIRDVVIRDIAIEETPGGAVLRYRLENIGTDPLRPEGRLEVRSLEGRVVATVRLDPFGSLPGRVRVREIPLPEDLPLGPLLAVPILDFGADHLAGGQVLFDHDQ
ncbi:MAG: hypothetical protein KY397_03695 [Gemmatimonadetes bacterium]|nr:hypothetical protein [Gemmatimonadota bacterium]